jgi:hypothetical protein
MKLGIFYEHQLPKPWNEGDEHKLFQDALDQIELDLQEGDRDQGVGQLWVALADSRPMRPGSVAALLNCGNEPVLGL